MKKINESFICLQCWKQVPMAEKTCRNHCPFCFTSQHVDAQTPWDRGALESCWAKMFPRMYEIKNGQTKIYFVCEKCGKTHWNKSLPDDILSELDLYIEKYRGFFE